MKITLTIALLTVFGAVTLTGGNAVNNDKQADVCSNAQSYVEEMHCRHIADMSVDDDLFNYRQPSIDSTLSAIKSRRK